MHPLIFSIGKLLESSTGTREDYSFDGPVDFDGIEGASSIQGKVQIMRLDDGVNVHTSAVTISVVFQCQRCLKDFKRKVQVKNAERQFLIKAPRQPEDINDLYLIDMKKHRIDLTEMLRQEIILHFPLIPVCSNHCQGICPHCGQNLNEATCQCADEILKIQKDNKPLAALKKLIK
ncbi:DUF177 domain-containing protein [Candidatus Peregrinibacteria bacterium]|nr:DUF177 domain-containing protein [Candidatus Peregrinibacteria bacterium]